MFFDDDPSLSLSAPQTSSTKEYTGVLLVGPGHSLYPCTDDASLPKGLLPIANRPMMEWALTWLEEGGVKGEQIEESLGSALTVTSRFLIKPSIQMFLFLHLHLLSTNWLTTFVMSTRAA